MLDRRPRRLRRSPGIRHLVQEHRLHPSDFMLPLFLVEGENSRQPVGSMPGVDRLSVDLAIAEIEHNLKLGVAGFALFPLIPESRKDKLATESHRQDSFYLEAIRRIKEAVPEAWLVSDVAMDPYSSDGHDGIVEGGAILNDPTLQVLGKMAVAQAQAGIDMVGPSDMMDGRVAYLRTELDEAGYDQVGIMSYTAKYASAFYGPFREALDSAPKAGDKKTYQMNPANSREALVEAELDELEGADVLMVKPALAYLDIIQQLKEATNLPVAAYNVSGEYAMLKAAAQNGWLEEQPAMLEMLLAMKRAGADIILTYWATAAAQLLKA